MNTRVFARDGHTIWSAIRRFKLSDITMSELAEALSDRLPRIDRAPLIEAINDRLNTELVLCASCGCVTFTGHTGRYGAESLQTEDGLVCPSCSEDYTECDHCGEVVHNDSLNPL